MNKKVLAVVGVLVVIVGLYGAYRVYKHFKRISAAPAAQTQTANTAQATPSTTLNSLKALIAQGVAQTCSYNTGNSQGTIYMDGGKVRADITLTDVSVNKQPVKSHMIIADSLIYVWTEGRNTGFKMAYDPNATPVPAGTKTTNAAGMLDPTLQMNYKCGVWIADPSEFNLPTGINFSSISLPSQDSGAPATGGAGSSSCSYCNSLTGADKTKCLTALNCN
jgi:hypothetical protein